jgi:hypothetical protein
VNHAVAHPRSPRATLRLVAVLLAVALLGGAVYLGARLYPWLSGPGEPEDLIEARWTRVIGWGQIDRASKGAAEHGGLAEAARVLGDFKPDVGSNRLARVDREELLPEQQQALAHLVRWAESGAPYPAATCGAEPKTRPMDVFRLGQAGLSTASSADDLPQVKAVAALAQRLRQRGLLLELAMGAELAASTAEWSRERKVPLPASFAAYRPLAAEIHAAVSRDAACVIEMIEGPEGATAGGLLEPGPAWSAQARPPLGIVWMKREVLVFKAFRGRVLEAAYPQRDDWRAQERLHRQALEEMPRSLLLDAGTSVILPSVIQRAGEHVDRYAELVGEMSGGR